MTCQCVERAPSTLNLHSEDFPVYVAHLFFEHAELPEQFECNDLEMMRCFGQHFLTMHDGMIFDDMRNRRLVEAGMTSEGDLFVSILDGAGLAAFVIRLAQGTSRLSQRETGQA